MASIREDVQYYIQEVVLNGAIDKWKQSNTDSSPELCCGDSNKPTVSEDNDLEQASQHTTQDIKNESKPLHPRMEGRQVIFQIGDQPITRMNSLGGLQSDPVDIIPETSFVSSHLPSVLRSVVSDIDYTCSATSSSLDAKTNIPNFSSKKEQEYSSTKTASASSFESISGTILPQNLIMTNYIPNTLSPGHQKGPKKVQTSKSHYSVGSALVTAYRNAICIVLENAEELQQHYHTSETGCPKGSTADISYIPMFVPKHSMIGSALAAVLPTSTAAALCSATKIHENTTNLSSLPFPSPSTGVDSDRQSRKDSQEVIDRFLPSHLKPKSFESSLLSLALSKASSKTHTALASSLLTTTVPVLGEAVDNIEISIIESPKDEFKTSYLQGRPKTRSVLSLATMQQPSKTHNALSSVLIATTVPVMGEEIEEDRIVEFTDIADSPEERSKQKKSRSFLGKLFRRR